MQLGINKKKHCTKIAILPHNFVLCTILSPVPFCPLYYFILCTNLSSVPIYPLYQFILCTILSCPQISLYQFILVLKCPVPKYPSPFIRPHLSCTQYSCYRVPQPAGKKVPLKVGGSTKTKHLLLHCGTACPK